MDCRSNIYCTYAVLKLRKIYNKTNCIQQLAFFECQKPAKVVPQTSVTFGKQVRGRVQHKTKIKITSTNTNFRTVVASRGKRPYRGTKP